MERPPKLNKNKKTFERCHLEDISLGRLAYFDMHFNIQYINLLSVLTTECAHSRRLKWTFEWYPRRSYHQILVTKSLNNLARQLTTSRVWYELSGRVHELDTSFARHFTSLMRVYTKLHEFDANLIGGFTNSLHASSIHGKAPKAHKIVSSTNKCVFVCRALQDLPDQEVPRDHPETRGRAFML